jgi:hypothetical protein
MTRRPREKEGKFEIADRGMNGGHHNGGKNNA